MLRTQLGIYKHVPASESGWLYWNQRAPLTTSTEGIMLGYAANSGKSYLWIASPSDDWVIEALQVLLSLRRCRKQVCRPSKVKVWHRRHDTVTGPVQGLWLRVYKVPIMQFALRIWTYYLNEIFQFFTQNEFHIGSNSLGDYYKLLWDREKAFSLLRGALCRVAWRRRWVVGQQNAMAVFRASIFALYMVKKLFDCQDAVMHSWGILLFLLQIPRETLEAQLDQPQKGHGRPWMRLCGILIHKEP